MSSEKFEDLEDDFRLVLDDLRRATEDKIPRATGEQKRSEIRHAEKKVEEAQAIINQMDEEVQGAPPQYRSNMGNRLRGYKRDFGRVRQSLKQASGSRDDQFGTSAGGFSRHSEADRMEREQRDRLLQGTQALSRASDSVARSHQISAQTDEIGIEILGELDDQRDTLLRAADRVADTDEDLSRSRKLLNGIARRVMTNKLIMACIILVELAIIGGVAYYRFH